MRKTQLLKFLAGYLIGAAGLICVPAYPQNTVEIVGERTVCTGDCTGVVWNGVFMQVSMPGSGVSNTTYAAGNNDGTTGTEPKFNRTAPGCQREGYFWLETKSYAEAGNPPGVVIMNTFQDPLYEGPGWVKIQNDRIYHEWQQGWTYIRVYRTQIHYMYNVNTKQVAQMKFKNSFAYGCEGYAKSIV